MRRRSRLRLRLRGERERDRCLELDEEEDDEVRDDLRSSFVSPRPLEDEDAPEADAADDEDDEISSAFAEEDEVAGAAAIASPASERIAAGGRTGICPAPLPGAC